MCKIADVQVSRCVGMDRMLGLGKFEVGVCAGRNWRFRVAANVERDYATSRLHIFVFWLDAFEHNCWYPKTRLGSVRPVAFSGHPFMPHRQRQFHHTMLLHELLQAALRSPGTAVYREKIDRDPAAALQGHEQMTIFKWTAFAEK